MIEKLEYLHDDGEVLYLTDGKEYYGLSYYGIDKADLREYANIEPTQAEKDEDGDLCYYYDDDLWEVDYEILEKYIKDYIKYGYEIYESGDVPEPLDGALFKLKEGDNGWHETLQDYLKEKNI